MSRPNAAPAVIRLRGVRQNNLKNFDLELPTRKLIVITGLSGSGKSSLAFDTLFAEGQRRYIETFSPYARQFLDRMDKPQVDSIEGIPPAIAIEQRTSVKTTRSTVGTMTELCDYAKVLWPQMAELHCSKCGQTVAKETPQDIWKAWQRDLDGQECLITFDLPLSPKLSLADTLGLIAKQGYQRVLIAGETIRIEDAVGVIPSDAERIRVIQDRLRITVGNRSRFIESCAQAYDFGKHRLLLTVLTANGAAAKVIPFSNALHCARCDISFREPSPALFSFNHPVGACPACRGFGRIITIDYERAIPDRTKTLAEGAVKPWQTGTGEESQRDLLKFCRTRRVPTNIRFCDLTPEQQTWVIDGDPGYGQDAAHEWPNAWYGVKGYFRWLESKAYKMHVRVLLSRYRAYTKCPSCDGRRFQPEALLYQIHGKNIAEFYDLPISQALNFVARLSEKRGKAVAKDTVSLALSEVRTRLGFLEEVGLGYLTLNRASRSLSGGETERVNLTTCLGSRLVNTLFVLDEPSVGLHPRDTGRLITILQRLRDSGNTVVVVEHESSVMRAADQVVDIGPGHGESGGQLVFQGTVADLLRSKVSLTGRYLQRENDGALIAEPIKRGARSNAMVLAEAAVPFTTQATPTLILRNGSANNLQNVTVEFPLHCLVCVTGVSGSGKTTLVRDILVPALLEQMAMQTESTSENADEESEKSESEQDAGAPFIPVKLEGVEQINRVVLVDQSALGKTPRSNPAVYIGAFEYIRELFAQTELARQRGLNASAFSFNSAQGQCEKCRGAGFEKIEMQFLSDVFIRCSECNGRRYRPHILEAKINGTLPTGPVAWSIADLLDSSVEEVTQVLSTFDARPAKRAVQQLRLLEEVGLGYLKVGQPINTLSGGETQRLKLVRHLAEEIDAKGSTRPGSTLFIFDEPTTGLHFADVEVLLKAFRRMVTNGNSLIVIEHNLQVIGSADWIIDLGPEAGDHGGKVVATGTPATVATTRTHTGVALREYVSIKR